MLQFNLNWLSRKKPIQTSEPAQYVFFFFPDLVSAHLSSPILYHCPSYSQALKCIPEFLSCLLLLHLCRCCVLTSGLFSMPSHSPILPPYSLTTSAYTNTTSMYSYLSTLPGFKLHKGMVMSLFTVISSELSTVN